MSKKRVLNLTSRKKRNTMLSYANTSTSNGGVVTAGPGPLVVNGVTGYVGIFCPTAMDLTNDANVPNTIIYDQFRTSRTCFMKGFSEHLRIQTNSGVPWYWRRICFTAKSDDFLQYASGEVGLVDTSGFPAFIETSNGMQRIWRNQTINNATNTLATWRDVIFKGTIDRDWSDILTAPVDTARVDLKYDHVMTIRSGNSNGTVKYHKNWYRMNKNLVYDDDEQGKEMKTSFQSTQDKRGMGDYLILDIIQSGVGATSSDLLSANATSTMYWHEK